MTSEIVTLNRSFDLISSEIGILSYISKLPSLNHDPNLVAFGIWPCNTAAYSTETFGGRSSGCAPKWEKALLTTLGETIERYCPSIYNLDEAIHASYQELGKKAVHPGEFALFHPKQYAHYAAQGYNFIPFTPELPLHWFPCIDLVNGEETWCPGAFIYLPWTIEEQWININTSTGLAAHSDFHQSILLGLYECIERDAFVMSWAHEIFREKIVVDASIRSYISAHFPGDYEWHFFDINYDLETPTVFGICFGTSDFGPFVAVGTSARATYGEALKKVVNEIGQAVSYFRYLLGERKDWVPDDNYNNLQDFEEHSIFYLKRPDMLHAFDPWRKAVASKTINLHEPHPYPDTQSELKRLLKVFRQKGYNVLAKDLTLPDVRSCGYFATAVFVPQLLQMNGAYEFYFLGGRRLYEVPRELGLSDRDYDQLNPHPHPFP